MGVRTVELDVYVRSVRGESVDVEYDGVTANLPLSQVSCENDLFDMVGDEVTIEIPEWLAMDRGLI